MPFHSRNRFSDGTHKIDDDDNINRSQRRSGWSKWRFIFVSFHSSAFSWQQHLKNTAFLTQSHWPLLMLLVIEEVGHMAAETAAVGALVFDGFVRFFVVCFILGLFPSVFCCRWWWTIRSVGINCRLNDDNTQRTKWIDIVHTLNEKLTSFSGVMKFRSRSSFEKWILSNFLSMWHSLNSSDDLARTLRKKKG